VVAHQRGWFGGGATMALSSYSRQPASGSEQRAPKRWVRVARGGRQPEVARQELLVVA
jgi:hypothetical protein